MASYGRTQTARCATSTPTVSALPAWPCRLSKGWRRYAAGGYVDLVGGRLWAQYSAYIAGSELPARGLLIDHSIFIDSQSRARLRGDIVDLSDAVHGAFLARIDTVEDKKTMVTEVSRDGA